MPGARAFLCSDGVLPPPKISRSLNLAFSLPPKVGSTLRRSQACLTGVHHLVAAFAPHQVLRSHLVPIPANSAIQERLASSADILRLAHCLQMRRANTECIAAQVVNNLVFGYLVAEVAESNPMSAMFPPPDPDNKKAALGAALSDFFDTSSGSPRSYHGSPRCVIRSTR
jgi:hypothetical protein